MALRQRLRLYAARRRATESSVVESALNQYLDHEMTDRALILRRLNRVDRQNSTLQRDFDLLSQAFGVFVQVWFAHTPQIPEGGRAAAEQTALKRYGRFLDHVSRQLEDGSRFARELAPDSEPDTEVRDQPGGGTDLDPGTK
jgi:hypothetical protein